MSDGIGKMMKKLKTLPVSKSSFLVILGIIGLLLVMISTFSGGNKKNEVSQKLEVPTAAATDSYTDNIEQKLEALISDMLGGTKVTVMVTLENGVEYVYADEYKTGAEVKKDQTSLKTEQNDSNQKNYVVIKDADGNERALLVTEKMPIIRGVVVVCDSGQTETVSAAVKSAVRSALCVDEDKICIIGRHL